MLTQNRWRLPRNPRHPKKRKLAGLDARPKFADGRLHEIVSRASARQKVFLFGTRLRAMALVTGIRGFIALGHPVVDSGILPSALRANAYGVIQNRSRRFCHDISTSMYKKPLPQFFVYLWERL